MSEPATVTLADPSSPLTAVFVPGAGMIGTSLAENGDEYLGQRRGLDAYISHGKTMGIPLLYPWANRLGALEYTVADTVVRLTPGEDGVRADGNGAPIHGVLAAYPGWTVTAQSEHAVTAEVDYDEPKLLAAFPFPHRLTQSVTLTNRTLVVETTVTPTTSVAVPVCFGYHPYVCLPGVPRDRWSLATPAMRHLPVDGRGIPTGAHDPQGPLDGPLAEYDDGYDEVAVGAVFTLSGGGRRVDVTFEAGYPAAQLFAPPTDDLVAIEPMTAPTDALRRGGYRLAVQGSPDTSRFSITVR